MALNFPNTDLYEGLQYTGDNGVTYIYDGEKWVGRAPAGAAGTNSITNGNNVVQIDGDGNLVIPTGKVIKDASGATYGGGGTGFTIGTVDLHNGGVSSAQILQFDNASYQSVITGPTPDAGNTANRLIIQGQRATGQGEGGDVYVWGGDSDHNGGDIKIYAGDADSGQSGDGGYVNISAGYGHNTGGDLTLTAGGSQNNPGNVRINTFGAQWSFNADGTLANNDGLKLVTDRGTLAIATNMEVPGVAGHLHIAFDGSNTTPPAGDLFLGDDYNYVKLPGYELNTADYGVEIGTEQRGGPQNVVVDAVDELVPPGGVWRLFIIIADYPTLGSNISVGATVTPAWGAQVSATITGVVEADGDWQIQVDQDITAGFDASVAKTVSFGTSGNNYVWRFGTDGNTTFPNNSTFDGQTLTDSATGVNYTLKIANGGEAGSVFGIGTGDATYGITNDALNHNVDGYVPYTITAQHINLTVSEAGTWAFGADGSITFPDNTVQTTAYTGQSGSTADPNIWVQTFVTDDVTDIVQIAISVEYDADNNIIALFDHVDTDNDSRYYSVGKFSPTGSRVWTARFGAGFYTDGWGLAVDQSSGAIYVTGSRNTDAPGEYTTSVLVKLNGANGQISWAQTYDFGYQSNIAVVDVASDGNPVMVGWVNDGTAYISTTKVDMDNGAIIWTRKINGQAEEAAYGMAVGPNGEVVVVGYMSQLGIVNAATTLYSDPVSNVNWTAGTTAYLGGVGFTVDITDGVPTFSNISDTIGNRSVDDVLGSIAGNVLGGQGGTDNMTVKVGSVASDDNASDRIVVVKYASDGTIAWQKAIQFDAGWDCSGADADIDSDGNIYVCGSYTIPNQFNSSGIGILKLDSTGVKQWSRRVVGPCTAQSSSIVVGPDNKLYISAVTIDPSPSFKWVVAKYGFDGLVEWQKFVDNTTTLEIAGTSYNGNGGGSNLAVTNDYVALAGGFGDFANGPTNTNIHAVVAQVPASGTAFVAGDWDFTDSGLSGTLNSSASDVTVVAAQLTDSNNTALENSSTDLNTDNSNFLIGTIYHAPGVTNAELIGDGFQASTGSKTTIYTNTFGFQGGEEQSILVSDPDNSLRNTYTVGSSITFRNGEVKSITNSEDSGDDTWFYWSGPVAGPGGGGGYSGPNPRYPVTLKTADYSDGVQPTARIKPDLAEANNHLQYMKVYAGQTPPATSSLVDSLHIHMAGGENNVELFLGTDDNYVSAKEAGYTPAGVRLHSEVDVSVVDTDLRLDRKGSTWASVYGDGQNRDLHNNTSDLSWSTIAVDEHGDYYVGGESNNYTETIVNKYSRDGSLLWSKYNNGATYSGWSFDGIAYSNGQVATLVKTNTDREEDYYKLTVHDSATGSTLTTTDIYDPDGNVQAHSMIYHSYLGWTVVGQTYGEQYSTGAITITNSPYYYDVIRLPAASCLINGQYPASNNNWRITGTNLPNGGQYLNEGVGVFNNVPITTVTGGGSGAYFIGKVDYNAGTYLNYGVGSFGGGTGYAYGDQLKILGSLLGGVDGVNDMLFTANPQGDVMWGAENITGTPNLEYITIDMNYNMGYSEVDFRDGTFTLTIPKWYRPWIWTGQWTRYLEPVVDAGNQYAGGRANCVAEDPLTQALVVGGYIDNPGSDGTSFVWKLAADGSTTWAKTIDNDREGVYGVAVSTLDSAIYVGTDWSSINKISSEGYLLYRAVPGGMWGLGAPEVKLAVEEDGIEYLYVGGSGGSAWNENQAFMLSKLTTDFKTVWGRAMDYSQEPLYRDYDSTRTKFALGKGQATFVGYGDHYSQNRTNAIIYTISTADKFETVSISGWQTYQDANHTWEYQPGYTVFDLINAGAVASTSTAVSEIATDPLDWTNFAFESRLVNLNKTKRGIVGVESIEFADGGTLDHNPADIPPSMFFDPYLNNWEYTLQLSDRGRFIINQAVPNEGDCQDLTIYIPRNDQVAFPVGTVITLINSNSSTAGGNRIHVRPIDWNDADGQVYIWSTSGSQNSSIWSFQGIQTATLMKISTNAWLLTANNLQDDD